MVQSNAKGIKLTPAQVRRARALLEMTQPEFGAAIGKTTRRVADYEKTGCGTTIAKAILYELQQEGFTHDDIRATKKAGRRRGAGNPARKQS